MFKPETKLLVQEPTVDTRLLRSATVVEARDESFSIRFDAETMDLDAGLELILYFHGDREFMQQIVRVIQVVDSEAKPIIELESAGDPVPAENRQAHRVSAISADIIAALAEDRNLPVQDVSSTGFAVVSAGQYPMGSVLQVSLSFEDDIYSGQASVQNVREFTPTRIRYGLRATEEGDLQEGLHQISLALQRAPAQK